MEFKLDNAAGELVDLTPFDPQGLIRVVKSTSGLSDGQYFTISFLPHAEVYKHLADIDNLNTGESQTYLYKRGSTTITGECFIKEIRPTGERVRVVFKQTGSQLVT